MTIDLSLSPFAPTAVRSIRTSLCAATLFAASARAAAQAPSQPRLTLIDSVRITENERIDIGKPNAIAVAPDGAVFISDISARRVIRADRKGVLTVVAPHGGGPGEVEASTALTVMGDSLLVIKNSGRRRFELFDLHTLRFRSGFFANWKSTSLASWHGTLIMGALSIDSLYAFAIVTDSLHTPTHGGTVPEILRKNPPVAQAFGDVHVARDDSTVFGVFEVSNTMYRWRLGKRLDVDSIVMRVSTRRGAKPDVIERLLREPNKAAELAFTWSAPLVIAPLSAQRTAALFYDPTMQGTTYTGPSFLQIVDWRSHKSCGEIRLPVPSDVVPRFAFRDDTLVAIVQHSDEGEAWIVRWKISAGRC